LGKKLLPRGKRLEGYKTDIISMMMTYRSGCSLRLLSQFVGRFDLFQGPRADHSFEGHAYLLVPACTRIGDKKKRLDTQPMNNNRLTRFRSPTHVPERGRWRCVLSTDRTILPDDIPLKVDSMYFLIAGTDEPPRSLRATMAAVIISA